MNGFHWIASVVLHIKPRRSTKRPATSWDKLDAWHACSTLLSAGSAQQLETVGCFVETTCFWRCLCSTYLGIDAFRIEHGESELLSIFQER